MTKTSAHDIETEQRLPLPVRVCEQEPHGSGGQLTEELTQLGCRLKLRNRIELLLGAGERIRQAPHGSRRKLRMLRFEVHTVDLGQQALRSVELAIHKRRVEDQLRLGVSDLGLAPRLDLALHRLKVPMDSIHTNRQCVDQIEALAVLGQHRREHA